jgi:hypothetical protein
VEDVDEAIRLVRASKASLEDDDTLDSLQKREIDDPTTRIYRLVCELIKASEHGTVRFNQVRRVQCDSIYCTYGGD